MDRGDLKRSVCGLLAGVEDGADRCSQFSEGDWQLALDFAVPNNLGPLLYRAVRLHQIQHPSEIEATLRQQYQGASLAYLKRTHESRRILSALDSSGIPVIPLKGVYLAEKYYEDPVTRVMCDVDLLVRRSDWIRAVGVLRELEYESECEFDLGRTLEYQKHAPPMIGRLGIVVELHSALPFSKNTRFLPVWRDTIEEQVWQRSGAWDSALGRCSEMAVEDNLIFLAMHVAQHEFSQCVLRLFDINLLIRQESVDWDELRKRITEYDVQRIVHSALVVASELFESDVPEDYLRFNGPAAVMARLRRRVLWDLNEGNVSHGESESPTELAIQRFNSEDPREKIRHFYQSFFSTDAICSRYPVSPNSPLRFLYCVPRIGSLIKSYARSLVKTYVFGRNRGKKDFFRSYRPVQKWLE